MNFVLNPYEKYILLNCFQLATSIMQKKIENTISYFYHPITLECSDVEEINEKRKQCTYLLRNLTLFNLYQNEHGEGEFEKINKSFVEYKVSAKARELFKFIVSNKFKNEEEKIKCCQSLDLSEIQLTKLDNVEINEAIKNTIKEIDFKKKIMSKEEVKSMSYLIWKTKENNKNLLSIDQLKYMLDNNHNISHYLFLYELESFLNIDGVNKISYLCFPTEYQDIAKLNCLNKNNYQGFDEIFLLDDPVYQKYNNFLIKLKEDKEKEKNKRNDNLNEILLSKTW